MIKINIQALFTPDIEMYKCDPFVQILTILNLVIMVLSMVFFFCSTKRLALPFILFQFTQNIYFMSLTNSLKDDCLANFLSSFDSFGFFRLANYFIAPVASTNTGSFLTLYTFFDFLLYNLLDILFYFLVLCVCYIILANSYITFVTSNYVPVKIRSSLKAIIWQFTFSIPLKFIELVYYPLVFTMMVGLFNSGLNQAADIIVFIVIGLFCIWYLFFSNTILTTYFGIYLRTSFLKSFGGLYAHLNFVDLRTIGKMIRQGGNDEYMLYRYINMVRGNLTFNKIFIFFQSMIIVYAQNTDGIWTYIVLICIIIFQTILFLFLKLKNNNFFYAAWIDHFYIWLQIVLFLNAFILLIMSTNPLSIQFSSIFLILIDMLFYTILLIGLVTELWKDQQNDILWKLRNNKKEKVEKKNEFIKLLGAEMMDLDGQIIDRKIAKKPVGVKDTGKSQTWKSQMKASEYKDTKSGLQQSNFGFVLNKYK